MTEAGKVGIQQSKGAGGMCCLLVEAQGGRGQSRGSCHVQSGSQVKLWEAVRQGRGQRVIRTAGSRLGKGMGEEPRQL